VAVDLDAVTPELPLALQGAERPSGRTQTLDAKGAVRERLLRRERVAKRPAESLGPVLDRRPARRSRGRVLLMEDPGTPFDARPLELCLLGP